jgi:sec-independent protein translocase protein TatB
MHFADSIVIFVLALVLFGPKRLPEIARQVGKLLAEFRRASNDFKMQIDDELRAMEQQERQKKLEAAAQQATLTAPEAVAGEPTTIENSILPPPASAPLLVSPPSTGETVSTSSPYVPVTPPEVPEAAIEAGEAPHTEIHSNGHAALPDAAPSDARQDEDVPVPFHHG